MDIIKKVLYNKNTKQKYILVPKDSYISKGDYVRLEKIENGGNHNGKSN